MFFEHYDLFTPIQLTDIAMSDGALRIRALGRDGKVRPYMRIRALDADRIELTHDVDAAAAGPAKSSIAHRCSPPNWSVTESLDKSDLDLLTPAMSISATFPQTIEGVTDADICNGTGYVERLQAGHSQGSIQFEVLGPVHFWVMGIQYEGKRTTHVEELDVVQAVRRTGPDTLKLSVLRDHGSFMDGWNRGGDHAETYDLTVIEKDTRFEIPELGATFIRCDPPVAGAHRWG